MPNHVQNIFTVIGDKQEIAKVFKAIKGHKSAMDFNAFLPLPKELQGTRSPVEIISQEEYDAQEKRIADGNITDMEKTFGLSRGITKQMERDLKKRFGATNWYDWNIANWDTKWNAYEVQKKGNIIKFQTAWSSPMAAMIKLSALFPEVEINVKFADEDMGSNVGEYSMVAGRTIKEHYPDLHTSEALEMAIDIWGKKDYYLIDILTEQGEKIDITEPYYKMLIHLANKKGCLSDKYPVVVLEKMKVICLAKENYERAKQLQDILDKKQPKTA